MTPSERSDLTDGRLAVRIVTFGIPLVLGMAFHALFNLVDLFIVGKLGTSALAAVTVASFINMVPMVVCNGISTSSLAIIARNIGFRNDERAQEVARQSLILAMGLAFAMGIPSYLYARELCVLVRATGEALDPATSYLQIMSLGTWTMFLVMQTTAIMRAEGRAMWPMIILVGANLLNVVLDYAFVFGKWGFPEMGAPGAAWATVLARFVGAVVGLLVLIAPGRRVRLRLTGFRLSLEIQLKMLLIGLPTSLQWFIRTASYIVLLAFVGEFGAREALGEEAHAAFGVGIRLDMFALFAGFGWGAAASTMVGQCLGRNLPDRASRGTWFSSMLNVLMMSVVGAAYFVFAAFLLRFFGANPELLDLGRADARYDEVIRIGVRYIRVVVFSYPFVAASVVLSQALNGAGSTKTPLAIDVVGLLLVQIPVAWLLAQTALGLEGIWYAIVGSNVLMALVYVYVFRVGRWKHKKLL
jgi:putative MATE family efflux protein